MGTYTYMKGRLPGEDLPGVAWGRRGGWIFWLQTSIATGLWKSRRLLDLAGSVVVLGVAIRDGIVRTSIRSGRQDRCIAPTVVDEEKHAGSRRSENAKDEGVGKFLFNRQALPCREDK